MGGRGTDTMPKNLTSDEFLDYMLIEISLPFISCDTIQSKHDLTVQALAGFVYSSQRLHTCQDQYLVLVFLGY